VALEYLWLLSMVFLLVVLGVCGVPGRLWVLGRFVEDAWYGGEWAELSQSQRHIEVDFSRLITACSLASCDWWFACVSFVTALVFAGSVEIE